MASFPKWYCRKCDADWDEGEYFTMDCPICSARATSVSDKFVEDRRHAEQARASQWAAAHGGGMAPHADAARPARAAWPAATNRIALAWK